MDKEHFLRIRDYLDHARHLDTIKPDRGLYAPVRQLFDEAEKCVVRAIEALARRDALPTVGHRSHAVGIREVAKLQFREADRLLGEAAVVLSGHALVSRDGDTESAAIRPRRAQIRAGLVNRRHH